MKNGEKVLLVPCISKTIISGSPAHQYRVREIMKSMSEEVTIVSLCNSTGNAKVKDRKSMVFYCNQSDLKPLNEVFRFS